MLKIAVFEDDESELKFLLDYSYDFFSYRNINYKIDCFNEFKEDYDFLFSYDIIFLDIEVGNKNGIDYGYQIRKKYPDLIIIIISKHPQYLVEGYRIDAKRYMLKPLSRKLFNIEMDSVLKSSSFKQQFGFYDKNIATFKIHYCEILYVESIGRKTFLHLINDKVIQTTYPLKKWLTLLDDKGFSQVYKSFIVNLSYIDEIKDNELCLSNDVYIPVSRYYKEKFKKDYYLHLRTAL